MLDQIIQQQETKVSRLSEELKREKKRLRKLKAARDLDDPKLTN